jgi:acyl-CoA thioesterase-2
MSWDFQCLSDLLALRKMGDGEFHSTLHDININGRIYGGQVLGQAIAAATQTVDNQRIPTALQLLFLKGGTDAAAVEFHVTSLQDGKRFSSRHVRAIQSGQLLCDAHVSFQENPVGIEHSEPAPETIPPPEALLTLSQLREKYADKAATGDYLLVEKACLHLCLIDHEQHLFESGSEPRLAYWLKLRNPMREPDESPAHYAALAYLSDFWVAASSMTAHAPLATTRGKLYFSSLNHSLWFHAPVRGDEWLLFVSENIRSSQGRGLSVARIYDRNYRHVASVSQECLVTETTVA